MGKIRSLSDDVIVKIAAGEVIERPAYVVKELIENSIDAKAQNINIEIEESGLKKILVWDDGEGMDKEDLSVCLLPHTTSKLEDDSLIKISTLGFRGEALSSIAATSDIIISSRPRNQKIAYVIRSEYGKATPISPKGSSFGTTVIVKNIFAAAPVRKKFVKNNKGEFGRILDIISQNALSNPGIGFKLTHNGKLIFNLPAKQSVMQRIRLLLGEEYYINLIPLKFEESYLKISGFICKPQYGSIGGKKQYIFVNQRRIIDHLISTAFKEAYGTLLETHLSPAFIVFLEIPFEMIDVNIHPRKETISFFDRQFIFDNLIKAATQTLTENNLTFSNLSWQKGENDKLTLSYAGRLLKGDPFIREDINYEEINWKNPILQIHNQYLICQSQSGVIVIDQHAASERVLFEKFKEAFKNYRNEKYHLPKALIMHLSYQESEHMMQVLTDMSNLGFVIEPFGNTSFKVEAVPKIFQDREIKPLLMELLEDLISETKLSDIDNKTQKMLAYLACRAAVKAGDKLSLNDRRKLIKELAKYPTFYTCPHGRPIKIELILSNLDKIFKRT